MEVSTSPEKVDGEDVVCNVCYNGDVYTGNQIIICERCNMAAHQKCYDVHVIPDGSWFCDVCATGADARTTMCELCSYKGESYKLTDKNQWVHSLCSNWIPEIFVKQINFGHGPELRPTLSHLDKKRYKLRCGLCQTKGACVQCSFGRCAAAVHPWCVFHHPQGFVKRVVKNEDGEPMWEIFCKAHAKCVTEPVKPKAKSAKFQPLLSDETDPVIEQIVMIQPPSSSSASGYTAHHAPRRLSMSHALDFSKGWQSGNSAASGSGSGGNSSQSTASLQSLGGASGGSATTKGTGGKGLPLPLPPTSGFSSGFSSGFASAKQSQAQAAAAALIQAQQSAGGASAGGEGASSSSQFVLHNMNEWPGQSEGEPLDLDHFWKVISMSYPKDYPPEWLDFMLNPIKSVISAGRPDGSANPPLGPPQESDGAEATRLIELADSLLSNVGNEFDRRQLLELEKWNKEHDVYKQYMQILSSGEASAAATSSSSSSSSNHPSAPAVISSAFPDDIVFLTSRSANAKPSKRNIVTDDSIRIVIDADGKRIATDYKVTLKASNGNSDAKTGKKGEHIVSLPASSKGDVMDVESCLVAAKVLESADTDRDSDLSGDYQAMISFVSSQELSATDPVYLADKSILPASEDDELCRLIYSEQRALEGLMSATAGEIQRILSSKKWKEEVRPVESRTAWKEIDLKYSQQRAWKKIASTMARGMKDQMTDFNKQAEEALPASWAVRVDGRPAPPVEEEPEPIEDSVCMVCFDGSSVEGNNILFCDGCNASMHQVCYGVHEIPEGDFFCDRCRKVQELHANHQNNHFDLDEARTAIMCCLCPLQHGALKPTTDGRWVHLCCAMWQDRTIVADLADMGPVDISHVPVQAIPGGFMDNGSAGTSKANKKDLISRGNFGSSPHKEACVYCKVQGGAVIACTCQDCNVVFHPLCAWFNGEFVSAAITDETFQGGHRDGLYPSGITFSFFCDIHTPEGHAGNTLRQSQSDIRAKYRIKEQDLDGLPGRRRRPKEKKAKQSRAVVVNVIKDLAPDIYDRTCACCLNPLVSTLNRPLVPKDATTSATTAAVIASLSVEPTSQNAPMVLEGDETESENEGEKNGDAELKNSVSANSLLSQSIIDSVVKIELDTDTPNAVSPAPAGGATAGGATAGGATADGATADGATAGGATADAVTSVEVKAEPIAVPATATTSEAKKEALVPYVTCSKCRACVHLECHLDLGGSAEDVKNEKYECRTCLEGIEDPRCFVCPRRGGLLLHSTDGRWAHAFCARTCPGGTSVHRGRIEARMVPKINMKQKCFICNRKHGVVVHCGALGCNNFFHCICGERSGRGYHRVRNGTDITFCSEHMPETIEKVREGYFIDGFEAQRLRYSLERARLIADQILKREKYKKLVVKNDGEIFEQRFLQSIWMHKGHKLSKDDIAIMMGLLPPRTATAVSHKSAHGRVENLAGFESGRGAEENALHQTEEDIDEYNSDFSDDVPEEQFWDIVDPKNKPPPKYPRGADMMYDREDEDGNVIPTRISGSWTLKGSPGEINLPKRLGVELGHLRLTARDVRADATKKSYVARLKEEMAKRRDETAPQLGTFPFGTRNEFEDFAATLYPEMRKQQNMNAKKFIEEMNFYGVDVTFPERLFGLKGGGSLQTLFNIRKRAIAEMAETDSDIEEPLPAAPKKQKSSSSSSKDASASQKKGKGKNSINEAREQAKEEAAFKKLQEQQMIEVRMAKDRAESHAVKEWTDASDASGPYMHRSALATEMLKNPLTTTLQETISGMTGNSAGFSTVMALTPVAAADPTERKLYSVDELYKLERKIQDIVDGIDSYEVPEVASEGESMRRLIEDWQIIPYAVLPDYDLYVRRLVCFDDIKFKLREHVYRSMSAFSRDFYTMLQNGRSVTTSNTQTWPDSVELASVFESLKSKSSAVLATETRQIHTKVFSVSSNSSSKSDEKTCGLCKETKHVCGWPKNKNAKEVEGTWLCPPCITSQSTKLIGNHVAVYWDKDVKFYKGVIDAYDEQSATHRVVYVDSEWEFMSLGREVTLFVDWKL